MGKMMWTHFLPDSSCFLAKASAVYSLGHMNSTSPWIWASPSLSLSILCWSSNKWWYSLQCLSLLWCLNSGLSTFIGFLAIAKLYSIFLKQQFWCLTAMIFPSSMCRSGFATKLMRHKVEGTHWQGPWHYVFMVICYCKINKCKTFNLNKFIPPCLSALVCPTYTPPHVRRWCHSVDILDSCNRNFSWAHITIQFGAICPFLTRSHVVPLCYFPEFCDVFETCQLWKKL